MCAIGESWYSFAISFAGATGNRAWRAVVKIAGGAGGAGEVGEEGFSFLVEQW